MSLIDLLRPNKKSSTEILNKFYGEAVDKLKYTDKYDYYVTQLEMTREVLHRHSDVPIMMVDHLIDCAKQKATMEYEYASKKMIRRLKRAKISI